MILYFGQQDYFYFYPLKSDGLTNLSAVATPGNIYLFGGKPTLANAKAGASTSDAPLLAPAITSWIDTDDGFGKKILIPRQADPEPTGETYSRTYYLAINVPIETGDTTDHAPVIKEITFTRLRAQESKLLITNSDLYKVAPEMQKFVCADHLDKHIDNAIEVVRQKFNTYDVAYSDIKNPSALKRAAMYLAIANFYFGQAKGQGSIEYLQSQKYERLYVEQMQDIEVEVQKMSDSSPTKYKGAGMKYFSSLRVLT